MWSCSISINIQVVNKLITNSKIRLKVNSNNNIIIILKYLYRIATSEFLEKAAINAGRVKIWVKTNYSNVKYLH